MADNEELHPVVQLLLKRMESHPEEFKSEHESRWWKVIEAIDRWGNDVESDALEAGLRKIRLEEAHVWALDELCNGEERRKEEEMRKATQVQAYQSAMAQKMSLQSYAQLGNAAHGAALQNALSIAQPGAVIPVTQTAPSLRIGNETLDESMLTKIKRSIGL